MDDLRLHGLIGGKKPIGDAVADDVRAGKTFSKDGEVGIVGTLPERQGDNAALSNNMVGTTLKLKPPKGIYDGIDDMVTLANALSTLGGKKFATGTFNATGSYQEISGLNFVPAVVVFYSLYSGSDEHTNQGFIIKNNEFEYFQSGNRFPGNSARIVSTTSGNLTGLGTMASIINSSGFTIYYSHSTGVQTIKWIAFE